MEAMPHSYNLRSTAQKRWSELPDDMLETILNLLPTMPDCFRFGAVCTSWRRIMTQRRNRMPPLLMLEVLSKTWYPKQYRFFTLSHHGTFRRISATMNFHRKKFRRPTRCHGSSKGWLFIMRSSKCFLLNPVTRSEVELPPNPWAGPGNYMVDGSTLSSPPTSSDCIAVLEVKGPHDQTRLASCRPAVDVDWTVFDYPDFSIRSMTFYEGKLCILGYTGITRIYAFESGPTLVGPTLVATLLSPVEEEETAVPILSIPYRRLVESEGELLLVVRNHVVVFENDEECEQIWFTVYKLDDDEARRWVRIDSLGSGRVLLMTEFSSESFSIDQDRNIGSGGVMGSQGFEGNCIYDHNKLFSSDDHLMVYSMENCQIRMFRLPEDGWHADWITPDRLHI